MVAEAEAESLGWAVVHPALRDDMDWGLEGDTTLFMGNGNAYLENLEVREEPRHWHETAASLGGRSLRTGGDLPMASRSGAKRYGTPVLRETRMETRQDCSFVMDGRAATRVYRKSLVTTDE